MSIAKYVKQFLKESNKIVVQPVVVTAETNQDVDEEIENEEVESIEERSTAHVGGALAADQFSKQVSSEKKAHGDRISKTNKQKAEQEKGSKSITADVEKSGNVSDYKGYKNTEANVQAQRQADLNKLSTNQYASSKDVEDDLRKSDSYGTSEKGKSETKSLKARRQSEIKTQKSEQLGSEEIAGQKAHHGVEKKESVDFINKFTFRESVPPAGSSKNPKVDPFISDEVKKATSEPEAMINKRLATQEQQKKAQVKGKKLVDDVKKSNSLETFIKNGEKADAMKNDRVKQVDKFNKEQEAGQKSYTQDVKTSNSFGVFNSGESQAKSTQSARSGELSKLQASQKAESYKGNDKKSMDVIKGVENPNVGKEEPMTGVKIKPKEDPKTKLEKDCKDKESGKMKDEAVYDAGNVKGQEGIDSRDDVSLDKGKYKKAPTKKTTDTKQSVANTEDPKESQVVTQLDKKSIEAAKAASKKKSMNDSVESRAETLVASLAEANTEIPSDEVLLAMRDILSKKAVELDESLYKSMIMSGYLNAFNEVTESSKQILRTKEVRKRLAELDRQ